MARQRQKPGVHHRQWGGGQGFGAAGGGPGGGGFGPGFTEDEEAPSPTRAQVTTTRQPVSVQVTQTPVVVDSDPKQTTVVAVPGDEISSASTATKVVTQTKAKGGSNATSESTSTITDTVVTSQITSPSSQALPPTSTTTSPPQTSTASASSAAASSRNNSRILAGSIVAGLTVLAAITFLLVVLYLRRKRRRAAEADMFNPNSFKRSATILHDPPSIGDYPRHPEMVERRPTNSATTPPRSRKRDLKYGARTDGQSAYNTRRLHDPFFDTPGQEQHLSPDEITHPTSSHRIFSASATHSSQPRFSYSGTSASGQVSTDGNTSIDGTGFLGAPPDLFSSNALPPTPSAPPPYLHHDSPIPSYTQSSRKSGRRDVKAPVPGP